MLDLTVTTKSLNVSVMKTCVETVSQPPADWKRQLLSEQEIQDITEGLIARVMKKTKSIDVTLPLPRMKALRILTALISQIRVLTCYFRTLTEAVKGVDLKFSQKHRR